MTILVNTNLRVILNYNLTRRIRDGDTEELRIYKGTPPDAAEMELSGNAWRANHASDLLIEWPDQAYFRMYDVNGVEDQWPYLRARLSNVPDPVAASQSGTGTWAAIYSLGLSIIGPVSTPGGDGIIIVNSLTFSTSGSPTPTYQVVDAGYQFTAA